MAVLSCYATLLQRSLTVTGLPPFTQREGCPPSTQRVGCPSSSQREDREEVLDISSSDDDKDYELIEMKTEDIRLVYILNIRTVFKICKKFIGILHEIPQLSVHIIVFYNNNISSFTSHVKSPGLCD